MKRINPSELCRFGEAWKGFRLIRPRTKFATVGRELVLADAWLAWMVKHDHIPVGEKRTKLEQIQRWITQALDGEFGPDMTEEKYILLSSALDAWEAEIYDELDRLQVYSITKVNAYDTDELLSHGRKALTETTVNGMDADSLKSFEEGTRCLALKLPTSAGFQLLRAVEGVMHQFYDVLSGGAPRPVKRNMGDYIAAMEKIPTIDSLMLDVLKNIKNLRRNPLMHPEDFLDMDEAQITFDVAKSAISAMVRLVNDHRKATGGTP
jgi:hypothetical protein